MLGDGGTVSKGYVGSKERRLGTARESIESCFNTLHMHCLVFGRMTQKVVIVTAYMWFRLAAIIEICRQTIYSDHGKPRGMLRPYGG